MEGGWGFFGSFVYLSSHVGLRNALLFCLSGRVVSSTNASVCLCRRMVGVGWVARGCRAVKRGDPLITPFRSSPYLTVLTESLYRRRRLHGARR